MNWKKSTIRFLSLIIFICGPLVATAFAQTTISGTVRAKDTGGPLPGVNIVVKGTTTGVSTDAQGKYSLQVPAQADSLTYSYIGYVTQTIAIAGKTSIDVVLEPQTYTGQQLVVVGYGSQEQKTITSSVTSVSAKNFQKGEINNVANLIQGKVPGLSIVQNGSDPNGATTIRLRGLSTIGGNSSPLIVVDGIPGASMSTVDPNDIQSMSVLKGASAAAIYGTRGANGVIIITTKSGSISKGKSTFNIEYSGSVTGLKPYRMQKVLTSTQFLNLANQLAQENPAAYGTLPTSLNKGSSTDWYSQLLRTGMNTVHELAVSGGTPQTSYRASVNYRDIEGIEKNTGFQQLNGNLNITQYAINNNLTIHLNITAQSKDQQFGYAYAFREATIYNPTAPVYDPTDVVDGGYYQNYLFDYYNPVAIVEQNSNNGHSSLLSGSVKGEYNFSDYVPGLSLSGFYSQQNTQYAGHEYSPSNSHWNGADRHGLATINRNASTNRDINAVLHYLHSFSSLNVDATAGYEYQQFDYNNSYIQAGNFITDAFGAYNLSASQDFNNGLATVSSYRSQHKLVNFFGRVTFDLQDTYFLTGSISHEGSTRFGPNNKWGTFPAVNGGVELTNLFKKYITPIPYFNSLKLRAGYGITGNEPPNDYLSELLFAPTGGSFLVNGNWIPSYGPSQNPNPNLKWEKKHEFDIGADFSLLNNRIQGSVDWYTNTTKDLILNANVPVPPNFASTEWINVGDIHNQGFEANLTFNAVQSRDFSWTTTPNITIQQRTKLVSLSNAQYSFGTQQILDDLGSPGQNSTTTSIVREGDPVGELYGYVFQGVSSSGDWIFKDLNGDGVINKEDQTVIGQGLPTFLFGFNNTLRYKNWDLTIFIDGTMGHDLLNTMRAFYEDPWMLAGESYNILQSSLSGPASKLRVAPRYSSFYVEKGNYATLRNVTIGYNIPAGPHSPFSSFRIYLSGQNLYVLTNYKGADPSPRYYDYYNGFNDPLLAGIDRRDTWFMKRQITLGVDVKF